MSYWLNKLDEIIEEQKYKPIEEKKEKLINQKKAEEAAIISLERIPGMTLAEFARRDLAVEIYSEVLESNIWLCSNNEIMAQIKDEAPGQVCYIVEELRHLIRLGPSPESLKKIHEAKAIYPNSFIKEVETITEGVVPEEQE